jgi:predicted anti-sigma-YlaC factor YlaD
MPCVDARNLMETALDGARPPELAEHLADCPDCAAEWSQLVALERLLSRPTVLNPPATFYAATLRRIDREVPAPWFQRRNVRGVLSLALILAGVAVIVSGLLSLGRAIQQPSELAGWLAVVGTAFNSAAITVNAILEQASGGVIGWPLGAALALAVALIWFGALVLPRQFHGGAPPDNEP